MLQKRDASLCYMYHILFILCLIWAQRGQKDIRPLIKHLHFFTSFLAHIQKFVYMQKQKTQICVYLE